MDSAFECRSTGSPGSTECDQKTKPGSRGRPASVHRGFDDGVTRRPRVAESLLTRQGIRRINGYLPLTTITVKNIVNLAVGV